MTATTASRGRPWVFWSFIVFMAALVALFIYLGTWQMHRLGEKEALIAAVEQRSHLAPEPLPPATEWTSLVPADFDFRPVSLTGHFVPDQTIEVFTSLSETKGMYSGPGYWVVVPFALDSGGTVLVNRGYVPEPRGADFANDPATPAGTVTVIGLARQPEEINSFTPAADAAKRIEWVRNPARLANLLDPALAPVAPLYVDLPAGEAEALPQGGETVMAFPNRHFEYAMTWYAFALITPIMLGFWIWRQRRGQAGK